MNGQPTILPSGAAFDVISLFKSILNQQFSYFHGVTIKIVKYTNNCVLRIRESSFNSLHEPRLIIFAIRNLNRALTQKLETRRRQRSQRLVVSDIKKLRIRLALELTKRVNGGYRFILPQVEDRRRVDDEVDECASRHEERVLVEEVVDRDQNRLQVDFAGGLVGD